MDFLIRVEHLAGMGAGFGPIESNKKIDVVSRFTTPSTFD
jgi:hypothetical protein